MSSGASRRYGRTLEDLKQTDYGSYRAIKSRVESYKTIADSWRTRCLEAEAALKTALEANK